MDEFDKLLKAANLESDRGDKREVIKKGALSLIGVLLIAAGVYRLAGVDGLMIMVGMFIINWS